MSNPADRPTGALVKVFAVIFVIIFLLVGGAALFAPTDQSVTQAKANVSVVPGKSYCAATGIDDLYTGDGHVQFFLTLTNSGGEPGTVSIIPVRHYDDGQLNLSGLDAVEVEVAAHETWSGPTRAYKYKAHEHEVIGCGVIVDGGDVITIEAVRL